MSTEQVTPILRYSRAAVEEQSAEAAEKATERVSKLNEAVTWVVLGVCLLAWAVVGLFLWVPRLLRAMVVFSVRLVQSTLTESTAEAAGRSLRSAANFYRRGFVVAVESIRAHAETDDNGDAGASDEAAGVEPGLLLRETAWAIAVWYVILWSIGPLRGTPLDLALVPWSDLWSGWVNAVWSVPELFRW
jgi:hypothetical protein